MAIQAVSGARTRKRSKTSRIHPWLKGAARVLIVLAGVIVLSILAFRVINPPITSVMVVNKLKGGAIRQHWVPIENISPNLPKAVIASEDGQFCKHWGVDLGAIRDAIRESGGLAGARG